MHRLTINRVFLVIGFAVTAQYAQAQGDVARGEVEFAVCAVCHGDNGEGNAALNSPRLSGMEIFYTVRQLQYFRDGLRAPDASDVYGTQMRAIAMTLEGDQVLQDLAAYIATLESPPAPATIVGADLAAGKASYALCQACHAPGGTGNEALNTNSLVGQHDWYVERQIFNYRDAVRGASPQDIFGAQMRPMVGTLTNDEAVTNVAAYIKSLQ
ncbi:MAG: c-type cytochrome [Gammaproteobacteria bacterium]